MKREERLVLFVPIIELPLHPKVLSAAMIENEMTQKNYFAHSKP